MAQEGARDLTVMEHTDPNLMVMPRSWVPQMEVLDRLSGKWSHRWLLGFRNITNTTNERTLIAGAFPIAGAGNSMPVVLVESNAIYLAAGLSCMAVDYTVRQKVGGTNLNFFYVEQVPFPIPEAFEESCEWDPDVSVKEWLKLRLMELIFTAWDMEPFAQELGDNGPPFFWETQRRNLLRSLRWRLRGSICMGSVEKIPTTSCRHFRLHDSEILGLRRGYSTATQRMSNAQASGSRFESALDPDPGFGARHPDVLRHNSGTSSQPSSGGPSVHR